jgi:hypothetical protein
MPKKPLRKHIHHLDKKLKFRLRLYVLISIVMLLIILYDIFTISLPLELAGIGILLGVFIGIVSARMQHLSWDHGAKKIVSSLDLIGIIISVIYMAFVFLRSKLIGIFLVGPVVGAVGFSITAGVMIGRIVGTRNAIIEILKEREII